MWAKWKTFMFDKKKRSIKHKFITMFVVESRVKYASTNKH